MTSTEYTVSESTGRDKPQLAIYGRVLSDAGFSPGEKVEVESNGESIIIKEATCNHETLKHVSLGVYQCQDCDEEFALEEGESA